MSVPAAAGVPLQSRSLRDGPRAIRTDRPMGFTARPAVGWILARPTIRRTSTHARGPHAAFRVLSAATAALLLAQVADAQQTTAKVPFSMGIPVAPVGLADQPLPGGPFNYKTAEQMDVRVDVYATGLEYPYSMAWLPTGEMLVTERAGRLRIVRDGKVDPKPVTGGPPSKFAGKSGAVGAVHGYMTLAVHPQFAQNHWIYFSYTKVLADNSSTDAVARAVLKDGAMTDLKDIWVGEGVRGALSILLTADNKLWIATSGEGTAQDTKTLAGKVMRLNDDGSVPKDNPFVGKEGYRPEIYSLGHRSSLGLTVNPTTHEVWLSEMGPERRRRDQRHPSGQELWLADREHGAHVSRPVAVEGERAHA